MIDLHHKFIALARDRKRLFNEMLAILPEIHKSGVWRKYASDIYEYAGRFGGIARSTVEKRLRIEKDLMDKPKLREAIVTAGVHKVALVAKIADSGSDSAFADRVETMSKSALETLSKELKSKSFGLKNGGCGPTLFDAVGGIDSRCERKTVVDVPTPCHAKAETIKIELDEEMTFLFLKLKNKYGRRNKEVMRMILKKVFDGEFATEKSAVKESAVKISPVKNLEKNGKCVVDSGRTAIGTQPVTIDATTIAATKSATATKPMTKFPTRHIPAAIKKAIIAKTAHRCAYPHCNRPGTVLHHRARFSETRSHTSLIHLCSDHHEFAHNGLIRHELKSTNKWLLAPTSSHRTNADELYLKYRRG